MMVVAITEWAAPFCLVFGVWVGAVVERIEGAVDGDLPVTR